MRTFPSDVALPKVEVHVTEVCNNRCSFCTTGWINAETGDRLVHVPRETIRAQLEAAYAQGARRALFQGGEPTVRRDLGDLLGDAWDLGYQATTIFTNARMAASAAGARWLHAMKVTWFQVSIQGGVAAAHDASVGVAGAFEQTVRGTKRLLELGDRVKINAVLTRHALDSLPALAELMIALGPEEVGLDTVKPSGAFEQGRESYAELCPPLGGYAAALRDAVLAMDRAGIVVRLTSFPPCLVPGAEHLVSEEAGTTLTHQTTGVSVNKLAWKRSLQVKAPGCAECAYDDVCGGVYTAYAAANGTAELRPLAARAAPPPSADGGDRDGDDPLTRALRRYFVRASSQPIGVRAVRALRNGTRELDCFGPRGDVRVWLGPPDAQPAYATTARFSVVFEQAPGKPAPDLRVVDAVVRALRRMETRLEPTTTTA